MRLHRRSILYIYILAIFMTAVSSSCQKGGGTVDSTAKAAEQDVVAYSLPDTLRVGTLYSPDSYFLYRDEPMGYEYELIAQFAEDNGVPLKVVVAANFSQMLTQLAEGETDVVAYDVPVTAEYKALVRHCGPAAETHQVLVQPLSDGRPTVTDVTQLPGKEVYVEKDSKYFYRLENLNNEVGGGICIKVMEQDSIITEDLMQMVADGKIPYTVIDSDIANFSSRYYDDIDVSLAVGLSQKGSWAVGKNNVKLAELIDLWAGEQSTDKASRRLYRRYYEESKRMPMLTYQATGLSLRSDGSISPYDDIFRSYAPDIGWDWRILAAQAYTESGFDVNQVSWAGAKGLMQLMPKTAKAQGCPIESITDPESNVKAAVKCIKSLDKSLMSKIPDSSERLKFILAAYNAGLAHILDAIALAQKYGMNPQVWEGNVRQALMMKSRPEYYNDPVVKYGFFRATQTVEYVDKVLDTYTTYKRLMATI